MLFLDSSKPEEVSKWLERGVINGVTTNPTILKKDGSTMNTIPDIVEIMGDKPVSVEVTSNDPDAMFAEALRISELGKNVNVKIPIHGPNGESNLEVINDVANSKVPVNVTACMSAIQGYLGFLAGGIFISLFGGRIADMGYEPATEIQKLKRMAPNALVILGSVREPHNIVEWLCAGANIVTVTPDILEKALYNARTAETIEGFLGDVK